MTARTRSRLREGREGYEGGREVARGEQGRDVGEAVRPLGEAVRQRGARGIEYSNKPAARKGLQ